MPECPVDGLPKTVGGVPEQGGLVVATLVGQMRDYFVAFLEVLDLVSDSLDDSSAIRTRDKVGVAQL